MRVGRQNVPTVEGREGQGKDGPGKVVTGEGRARERVRWCGFGEAPGDRLPTVINLVRENRFSPPAPKSAGADNEAVSSVLGQPQLCEKGICELRQQERDCGGRSPRWGRSHPALVDRLFPEPASSVRGTGSPWTPMRGQRSPGCMRGPCVLDVHAGPTRPQGDA